MDEYVFAEYDKLAIRGIDNTYFKFVSFLLYPNNNNIFNVNGYRDDNSMVRHNVENYDINRVIYAALALLVYSPFFVNEQLRNEMVRYDGMEWDAIVIGMDIELKRRVVEWMFGLPIITSSTNYRHERHYNPFTQSSQPNPLMPITGRVSSLYVSNQLLMFKMFVRNRTCVITGDTGTGKTTQVPKLIYYFEILFGRYEANKFDRLLYRALPIRQPIIQLTLPRKLLIDESHRRFTEEIGLSDKLIHPSIVKVHSEVDDNAYVNLPASYISFVVGANLVSKLIEYTLRTRPCFANNMNPSNPEAVLSATCIIIDELHEHDIHMDSLLTLCKYLDCRLVLMSATIQNEEDRLSSFYGLRLDSYFHIKSASDSHKVIDIRASQSVSPQDTGGMIVNAALECLNMHHQFLQYGNVLIFFPTKLQVDIFVKRAKDLYTVSKLYRGSAPLRRDKTNHLVIAASPIAESSVTIDSLVLVIDTGLYTSPYGGGKVSFITLNSMTQRKGRIGRVRPGTFIRLYDLSKLKNATDYSLDHPLSFKREINILYQLGFGNDLITPLTSYDLIDEILSHQNNNHRITVDNYLFPFHTFYNLIGFDMDVYKLLFTRIGPKATKYINAWYLITRLSYIPNEIILDDTKYNEYISSLGLSSLRRIDVPNTNILRILNGDYYLYYSIMYRLVYGSIWMCIKSGMTSVVHNVITNERKTIELELALYKSIGFFSDTTLYVSI